MPSALLLQGTVVKDILLIFFGAGCGGVLRYWVWIATYYLFNRPQFPISTLMVNVSGSLLMGFLFTVLVERMPDATHLRSLLLIGLLGGYTTFSSFSMETVSLLESGALANGFLNILLSVVLCLLATWLGMMLGKLM
jgi:CrcB protein